VRISGRRFDDQLNRLGLICDIVLPGRRDECGSRLSIRQTVELVVGEHALGVRLGRSEQPRQRRQACSHQSHGQLPLADRFIAMHC
jgi:hypothetical protein